VDAAFVAALGFGLVAADFWSGAFDVAFVRVAATVARDFRARFSVGGFDLLLQSQLPL
jgi:hypothetical protein